MTQLVAFLQSVAATRFKQDRGATMVEYGLMVALIAVVVAVAAAALGVRIAALFDGIL